MSPLLRLVLAALDKVGDTITKGSTLGATDNTDDLTFSITTASAITGGDSSGHIGIKFDPFGAVCQIVSWDLSLESIEVSTLPCGVSGLQLVANTLPLKSSSRVMPLEPAQ